MLNFYRIIAQYLFYHLQYLWDLWTVYNRLHKFIPGNGILYSNQYSFGSNHASYMAASNLNDKISRGLDTNRTTAAFFPAPIKSFDTIDHSILFNKLSLCIA